MGDLRAQFSNTSKEYAGLTRAMGTANRGIQTAGGNLSRLGLSQQVLIGNTNALNLGLKSTGVVASSSALGIVASSNASGLAAAKMATLTTAATGAVTRMNALSVSAKGMVASFLPLLGVAGVAGIVKALEGFAAEADRARVEARLFDTELEKAGLTAAQGQKALDNLTGTFRVADEDIRDAATGLLRYGADLKTVEGLLRIGGASALAAGQSAAQGFDRMRDAIVSENSIMLNSIQISGNLSTAFQNYAESVGRTVDELTTAEKAQAAYLYLQRETASEVEAIPELLSGYAGSVNDLAVKWAELRREVGEKVVTAFSIGKQAIVEALDVFLQPDSGLKQGNADALALGTTVIEIIRQFGLAAIEIGGFGTQLAGVFAGGNAALKTFTENFSGAQKTNSLTFQALGALLKGNIKEYVRLGKEAEATNPFKGVSGKLKDVGTEYISGYLAVAGNAMSNVETQSNALNERLDTLKAQFVATGGAVAPLSNNLGGLGAAGDGAEGGLTGAATGLVAVGTEADRALQATKDYTFMLSQGVQQGVRPFEGAMHLLTTALERQEGQMQTLASRGQFGANYQLAAEKADLLRAAIEELSGIQIPDPGINAAYGPLRDILPLVTATGDAVADVAPAVSILGTGYIGAAEGAGFFADSVGSVAIEMPKASATVKDYIGTLGGLPAKYEAAIANARVLGDTQGDAAIKAGVARQELERLLEAGLKPTDEAVRVVAAEYDRWSEASARAEAAQTRLKDAVGQAKTTLEEIKDAAGNIDLATFAEGGAEAAGDYLEQLIALRAQLIALKDANKQAFQAQGGNELLQALNSLIPKVEEVASGLLDAKAAADTLGDALEIFSALTDGALRLAEALGGDVPESLSIVTKGVEGLGGALQKALSGDVIGAITQAITTLFDVIISGLDEANRKLSESGDAVEKYGLEWLKANGYIYYDPAAGFVVDTAALGEYEQYLEAVEEHGKEIADQYLTIGENGKYAFDEGGLADYLDTQEQITEAIEEQNERRREALELVQEIADAESGSTASLNDSQLQYAVDSGQINEQFASIKQAKLDIIDAYGEYNDTLADLAQQEADLNAALASGAITQAEYNASMADIAQQKNNAWQQLGYDVGSYLESAKSAAAEIGLSDKELYEALLTGNDAVLGALSPQEREALSAGLNAYVATFGEFPPGMAEVATQLGYTIDGLTGQILDSSGNVVGATQQAATDQKAAISGQLDSLLSILGPAAQPLIDQLRAMYDQQAAAHTEGGAGVGAAAQQGLGAASITGMLDSLLAQLGPAAAPLIAELRNLYGQQANAHTTGAGTLGGAIAGAGSSAAFAQAQAAAKQLGQLQADKGTVTAAIGNLFGAASSTYSWGGGIVGDAIAGAADAQNKTQQTAVKSVADYLSTVQGGLLKDIAGHANDEAGVFSDGAKNVAQTVLNVYNQKNKDIKNVANGHIDFLGQVAEKIFGAASDVANAEAAGFAGKKAFKQKAVSSGFDMDTQIGISNPDVVFGNIASRLIGNYVYQETLPPEATKPYKPKDPGSVAAAKSSPKGSLNYIDKQIQSLQEQYDRETDPKKRAALAKKIKALQKERDKIDVLADKGASSGSGSSAGKGSGKDIGPKGSPSYIQEQIRKLDEQINKSTSLTQIRRLQKDKEALEAQLDKLLGRDKSTGPGEPAKGSVDYIQKQLQEAQAAYDSATTDKARSAAAERIKVLKSELEEKQALLKDAAKDAQEAVKGTVISIESPIADLGSLQYLAERVSSSLASLPATVSSASTAASASVTRLPESYSATVLPSYQAQLDVTAQMGGHMDRFGGHIDRFGAFVTRLERLERKSSTLSPLVAEARGLSLTPYQFK